MDDRHGARSTSRRQNPAYDRPVRLIPQKPDHVGSMTGMQADLRLVRMASSSRFGCTRRRPLSSPLPPPSEPGRSSDRCRGAATVYSPVHPRTTGEPREIQSPARRCHGWPRACGMLAGRRFLGFVVLEQPQPVDIELHSSPFVLIAQRCTHRVPEYVIVRRPRRDVLRRAHGKLGALCRALATTCRRLCTTRS